ncbi:MAG: Tad domain-containing protein [Bdellovibrionota bacterium]
MIKNQKGQVAIFIALIFQVLFLFFAMIVNVGMLVHQKVNLQNSVDLAAYYGAMKQAESLNAIAHVNYQIRQSWKLLAWRYRVIGMGGDIENCHPYSKQLKDLSNAGENDSYACNRKDGTTTSIDDYMNASFCATYIPFKPMPAGESTCRDLKQYNALATLGIPPATGVVSISKGVKSAVIKALNNIKERCEFVGPFNWMLLARFKVAFIRDLASRRRTINTIALGLSGVGSGDPEKNFTELNGDAATTGIRKTLEHNLTSANRESLGQLNIYNGLGADDCRGTSSNEDAPPAWLNEIDVVPAFVTALTDCRSVINNGVNTPGNIKYLPVALEEVKNPLRLDAVTGYPLLEQYLQKEPNLYNEYLILKESVLSKQRPFNPMLGYEKNPWCNAYVGVKAVTAPKIPFLPLSNVQLEARAFAKPFGGRIGPWFFKNWAPGQKKSSGSLTDRTDGLVPMRIDNINNVSTNDLKDPTRIPNYSRFPGDTKGMTSRAVLGQYTKAMFTADPTWRSFNSPTAIIQPIIYDPNNLGDSTPDFSHWTNIADDFETQNPSGDILAFQQGVQKPMMRSLELSAIAPDIFDMTYYSIDPRFYENYFEKIQKLLAKLNRKFFLLSDFGSRLDDQKLKTFSVADQISEQALTDANTNFVIDIKNELPYTVFDPKHLLTSWVPTDADDYDFDNTRFGRCDPSQKPSPGTMIPGDCINGGRVGYSVKLVNGESLRAPSLQLGGAGTAAGPLANPPPLDW